MPRSPAAHVARRQLARLRRGAIILGVMAGVVVAVTIVSYVGAYPTRADRIELARGLATSSGFTALLGQPSGIDTLAGFLQWRMQTFLGLVGGIWGLLVATRAVRGEEESGHLELELAGPVGRRAAVAAAGAALAGGVAIVWTALALAVLLAGSAAHGIGVGHALLFALTAVAPAATFAAVGVLTSQLAATRRLAAVIAGGVLVAAFLLRVVADSAASLDVVRWATPFGWMQEVHPLTEPRPAAVLAFVGLIAACAAAAVALAGRRDLGGAILTAHDRRPPRSWLLGSFPAQALRSGAGVALAWAAGAGLGAMLLGVLAKSAADLLSRSAGSFGAAASRLGGVDVASVPGYLGVALLFVVVAVGVYAASLAGAVREEEATGRIDALLALPVSRRRWLAGRLSVAVLLLAAVSLACGVLGWAGTELAGRPVAFGRMLETGVNCLPVALLTLGLGALTFGLAPRLTAAVAYAVIAGGFLIELIGAAIRAPGWLLDLSPFHHLAAVPAQELDWGAAAAMVAIGAVAAAGGVTAFDRRDLVAA